MTFYVIDLKRPYDSIATLPGFDVEQADDVMQHDSYYAEHCVLLTAEERKKFNSKCRDLEDKDGISEEDSRKLYESMKASFIYGKYLAGEFNPELSYSFWVTSVYDTRTTLFAIGADTVGSYDFDLSRISKKLGEKHFREYSTGKGKRFKDYSALVKFLNELGVKEIKYTKEDLIQACNDDSYYLKWLWR